MLNRYPLYQVSSCDDRATPPGGTATCHRAVNITEDPFSDGGRYLAPAYAIRHARRLHAEGADISDLRARFGLPVPVYPSRKSFLRTLTGKDDTAHAGSASLAAEIFAAWQGVDYIRTHDTAALRDATPYSTPSRATYMLAVPRAACRVPRADGELRQAWRHRNGRSSFLLPAPDRMAAFSEQLVHVHRVLAR